MIAGTRLPVRLWTAFLAAIYNPQNALYRDLAFNGKWDAFLGRTEWDTAIALLAGAGLADKGTAKNSKWVLTKEGTDERKARARLARMVGGGVGAADAGGPGPATGLPAGAPAAAGAPPAPDAPDGDRAHRAESAALPPVPASGAGADASAGAGDLAPGAVVGGGAQSASDLVDEQGRHIPIAPFPSDAELYDPDMARRAASPRKPARRGRKAR
jgi:hypothetical protein